MIIECAIEWWQGCALDHTYIWCEMIMERNDGRRLYSECNDLI